MSETKTRKDGMIELDTTDVDRWVGKPLGGGTLKDPIQPNDIRRWSQGMQNPNPLHFDDAYAEQSHFGRLVAPQSFAVCTDTSHGAGPAIQGTIPGQHMIFGGDEWWFFGPGIEPGDTIRHDRMVRLLSLAIARCLWLISHRLVTASTIVPETARVSRRTLAPATPAGVVWTVQCSTASMSIAARVTELA